MGQSPRCCRLRSTLNQLTNSNENSIFTSQFSGPVSSSRYLLWQRPEKPGSICHQKRTEWVIPGVQKVVYTPSREARPETHHYVRTLENAVLQGQAVFRVAEQLK